MAHKDFRWTLTGVQIQRKPMIVVRLLKLETILKGVFCIKGTTPMCKTIRSTRTCIPG